VSGLGIEKIPPFVSRAVLVDLARFRDEPRLDGGELVTADELRAAMQQQNVRVAPDDVVVPHSGWLSMIEQDPRRFGFRGTGDRRRRGRVPRLAPALAVGADAWGAEAVPFKNPEVIWQRHPMLPAQNGARILENLDTRELVRDGVAEFMCVLGQPLCRGAVQGIIEPVAIR
jgi:hypothetical protein